MLRILCILLLIFILIIFLRKSTQENYLGYGNVYGFHINPNPICENNEDCFPGYYYRSQKYQNMCEPKDMRLTKEPLNLVDNCSKTLEGNMYVNNCKLPI